jgi:hypothetical protein
LAGIPTKRILSTAFEKAWTIDQTCTGQFQWASPRRVASRTFGNNQKSKPVLASEASEARLNSDVVGAVAIGTNV